MKKIYKHSLFIIINIIFLWPLSGEAMLSRLGSRSRSDCEEASLHLRRSRDGEMVTVYLRSPTAEELTEERRKYERYRRRYGSTVVTADGVGVDSKEVERVFSKLSVHEKPTPQRGEVYLEDNTLRAADGTSRASVVRGYVGPKHMNYAREGVVIYPHHETLALAQRKEAGIDKGDYRRKEPKFKEKYYRISDGTLHTTKAAGCILFDAGHGVDHAHTVTFKESNSTRDKINFTPQNEYYNRVIRRALTGRSNALAMGYSYKEIAIYPQNPLMITRRHNGVEEQVPIPEGFLLMFFNRISASLVLSYYFPNLIDYRALLPTLKKTKPKQRSSYIYFRDYFLIPNCLVQDVWGVDVIDGERSRRRALWESEHVGYRSLSGRYVVIPEALQDRWTAAARNALTRSVAIQKIQRAAEYDDSVENMVESAVLFNDKDFVYREFSGTLYHPDLAKYWTRRAIRETERKGYPNKDIFYVLDANSRLPITTSKTQSLVVRLERNLIRQPSTPDIIKLMEFYDAEGHEEKYNEWSSFLTVKTREGRIAQSSVLRQGNLTDLSRVEVENVIVDLDLSSANIEEFLEILKCRAIRETRPYDSNLKFIEIRNMTQDALKDFLEFLESGFEHKGKRLFLDVRGTALKLPKYKRESVKKYVKMRCPKTSSIKILN